MINKEIVQHELIGLECEVLESANPDQKKIKGRVMDETQKMIFLRAGKEKKGIAKKDAVFRFKINDKKIIVKGSVLIGRPEDRIKKKIEKW